MLRNESEETAELLKVRPQAMRITEKIFKGYHS